MVNDGQNFGVGGDFGTEPLPIRSATGAEAGVPGGRIEISTPDGQADAYVFRPQAGEGPWPGVLMYTDIMGVRGVFKQMAQRLADQGYVVLLPNLFYRNGPPSDPPLSVHDAAEMDQLMALVPTLTRGGIESDAGAYLRALGALDGVSTGAKGCVGYCMSGNFAIWTAHAHPDQVAAVAIFHGGEMVTSAGDSPVNLAARTKASYFFGFAETDPFMTPQMIATLADTLAGAGVEFGSEVYPGTYHGFAVADAAFSPEASEGHWASMTALFERTLS
jgi:carboxymethylenebutenolidase